MQVAPAADGVAAARAVGPVGRFHLDDLGAEFGADARGERAGNKRAEFQDFQSGQR
ncbi:hypothetical protein D9M70_612750 [compost metagenome]